LQYETIYASSAIRDAWNVSIGNIHVYYTRVRQYIIVGQEMAQLCRNVPGTYSWSPRSQSGSCELLARAFTRRWSVSYPVLCSYTRRWLVILRENGKPNYSCLGHSSPFPISVTHYPLKNRRSLSLRRTSSWSLSILKGSILSPRSLSLFLVALLSRTA